MADYGIFQGENGRDLRDKLWRIYMVKHPTKTEISSKELMELAQKLLYKHLTEMFDYELKQCVEGELYEYDE